MLVFVLNKSEKLLMPKIPAKARRLLKSGKAKVVRKTPFTIKLLYETTEYTQPVIAGMDSVSKYIGCEAVVNNEVLYITKFKREQVLGLEKTQYNDAVAICCGENNPNIQLSDVVYYKKHVIKGDYQQTKGVRSEKKIPTGRLHGLRKFDFIENPDVSEFIKGKRTSGNFSILDIFGYTFEKNPNIKKECRRISDRCTKLTQMVQI